MIHEISTEVITAQKRIKGFVRKTPLEYSRILHDKYGIQVFLKAENYQLTGSFKIRGAFNKMLGLLENSDQKTIYAASTGNHAEAVAMAGEKLGLKSIIYMPENVNQSKLKKINAYINAETVLVGDDCIISEAEARKEADIQGSMYLSPYNDEMVVAGQGTIGVEILNELKEVDVVFVPVGGGGLISGIAGYVKSINRSIEIVGVQPDNSKVMYESINAGKILDLPSLPTISDGTAGGIEEGSITFDYVKNWVDRFEIVSEQEIVNALKLVCNNHNMILEGAAGLSVAAAIKCAKDYGDKKIVCILCGNKASSSLLKTLFCE